MGRGPACGPTLMGQGPWSSGASRCSATECVLLRVRSRDVLARCRAPEPAAAVVWLAAAVTGRVHPLERAAVAEALRGQPVDVFADASDALMRGVMDMPLQRPPWREAYESLRLPRLDKITRLFGWRLLHPCAAVQWQRLCRWCKVGTELRAAVCCSLSHDLRWG